MPRAAIGRVVDLYTLFYPSFALPLLDVSRHRCVKVWGFCSGLVLEVEQGTLYAIHEDPRCVDYAQYLAGTWISVDDVVRDISSRLLKQVVEDIAAVYGWFGVATSPRDDVELFASIYMSRNTDFHRNVVRWIHTIFRVYGGIDRVAQVEPYEIGKQVSRSYQVVQLPQAVKRYLELRSDILSRDSWFCRKAVLSIPYAGPKVADAYLLFVRLDPSYAPVDKNFRVFVKRFGLEKELGDHLPQKQLCIRYTCSTCPASGRCIASLARHRLGKAFGWLQTVAYTHTKIFCRTGSCTSCPLRYLCTEPTMYRR